MATRAAQEAEILNVTDAIAFIERHGVVSESARRGAVPVLVDAIAGATIHGNWWSHPKSQQIFAITRAVRDAPEILVCKLIDGKITFVHERIWPALVRLAERFSRAQLGRVREVHTPAGKHVVEQTPFPDWVPDQTQRAARRLSEAQASALLADMLAKS